MASFSKEFLSGTFYIAVAKYVGIAIQLFITAILARLLTPSDFGVIAIATVFIAFFNILSDVGVGVAVIQYKDLSDRDLDHLFSINILLGLFLSVIFFLLSGVISCFYNNGQLRYVCQILCTLIFFTCSYTVPLNILYRKKQFKYIAFANLSVQAFCGISAVFAALAGWGVYALVLSQVLSALLLFVVYTLKYRRHFYLKIDFSPLKRIYSYSVYNFAGTFFCYLTLNIDKLLVGKFIGTKALGYYEKSYRLVFLPISNLSFVITPVLHPLFSDYQNDFNGLQNKYLKIIEVLAYISFPLSVICFFLSKEVILIFFGYQWLATIPSFRVMSLAISFLVIDTTVGSVFNAIFQTKRGFYTMILMSSIMILSVCTSIFFWNNILSVAYAFLFAKIVGSIINFLSLMQGLQTRYSRFFVVLNKPILVSLSVFVSMYFLSPFLPVDNLLLCVIVKVGVWLLFTILFVYLFGGYSIFKQASQRIKALIYKE